MEAPLHRQLPRGAAATNPSHHDSMLIITPHKPHDPSRSGILMESHAPASAAIEPAHHRPSPAHCPHPRRLLRSPMPEYMRGGLRVSPSNAQRLEWPSQVASARSCHQAAPRVPHGAWPSNIQVRSLCWGRTPARPCCPSPRQGSGLAAQGVLPLWCRSRLKVHSSHPQCSALRIPMCRPVTS